MTGATQTYIDAAQLADVVRYGRRGAAVLLDNGERHAHLPHLPALCAQVDRAAVALTPGVAGVEPFAGIDTASYMHVSAAVDARRADVERIQAAAGDERHAVAQAKAARGYCPKPPRLAPVRRRRPSPKGPTSVQTTRNRSIEQVDNAQHDDNRSPAPVSPIQEVRSMPTTKTKAPTKAPAKRSTKGKAPAVKAKAKTPAKPAKAPAVELRSGPGMAADVLASAGRPMAARLIVDAVLAVDKVRPKAKRAYHGATPDETLRAQLELANRRGGVFVKTERGCFALRAWPKSKLRKSPVVPAGFKRGPATVAPAGAKGAARKAPAVPGKAPTKAKGKGKGKARPSGLHSPAAVLASSAPRKRSRKGEPTGVDPAVAAATTVLATGTPRKRSHRAPVAA